MVEQLDQSEIESFLVDANAGVLSLTDGTETYAIPESYGYDGECLYFQFVYSEDSQKMAFVEATEIATVTVFTENPTKSVVVRGRLELVPDADQPQAAAAMADNAEIPALNVLSETSPEDLSMTFYRLVPTEVSGRRFDGAVSESTGF
ncbi:pyridoxamine 5'-phosphate oxidase family protein [Halorussus marinus]|uniref:pyridoxamine 5'-phosphate oxidase family protein n=1 Tax=Halorussus marinus TaxID=2505976 RepID=UPI00106DE69F|nr:pyridoxamine 5'-phosphate oxidase family protein [Halorussus marinus]